MATKTKKVRTKPRSKRTKTAHLPGFEPSDKIPEVTTALELYHDTMSQRVDLTKAETEAHEDLVAAMDKHKIDYYETPEGLWARLSAGKRKAKTGQKKKDVSRNGDADE